MRVGEPAGSGRLPLTAQFRKCFLMPDMPELGVHVGQRVDRIAKRKCAAGTH